MNLAGDMGGRTEVGGHLRRGGGGEEKGVPVDNRGENRVPACGKVPNRHVLAGPGDQRILRIDRVDWGGPPYVAIGGEDRHGGETGAYDPDSRMWLEHEVCEPVGGGGP